MDAVTAIEAAARAAKRAFGIPHTVWEVEYSPTHKAIMIRERHEGRRPRPQRRKGGPSD